MSLLSTLKRSVQQNRGAQNGTGLDPETAYEMLRNARRRYILEYMAMSNAESVPVGDIADHLATCHDDDRTSAYVAAIQSHMPRMADAGVCRYDGDRKYAELTPRGRAVLDVHRAVVELLD